MGNSYNQICKDLIYVLKLLIYFDTYEVQSGGAGAAIGVAAKMAPGVAGAVAGAAGAPAPSGDAGGGDAGSKAEAAEKNEEKKESENKSVKRMMAIFNWITNLIMGTLKWFGKYLIKFSTMMLFAATFPIIPFFAVMAGMYGIIKYFMYKLRRL